MLMRSTFDIDECRICGKREKPLLSPVSELALRYYRGPEQKLADHAEDIRRGYQRPPARSQPQPRGVRRSLDSPEQVIGENEKTKQSRHLIRVRSIAFADRDFLVCFAVVREREPNEPHDNVHSVVAQHHP